ncbi:MAG: M20/M25/M40 family metallo-hydrolase [Epsilonproteobacteria bacterium]|nr:M20/M25/M40 family metallo-hydrolase [Campylobacterota bacterium]
MSKIFDYFQQITQIPHCSHDALKLRDFLVSFAKERGYDVQVDVVHNILISKGKPKLALQAHYDMVCVGNAPKIETYIQEDWMMAKNSTLGADNGMAIAMMMALMDESKVCEFVITSDEEVGLIGASALSFDLQAQNLLNLDSEDEAEVYIGCAGGVDIEATKKYATSLSKEDCYEITISGLPGGHSGVEIHKEIPNAIKLFGEYLKDKKVKIASIQGGERVNSIPVNLTAIVCSEIPLVSAEYIDVKKVQGLHEVVDGDEIISLIENFSHGVLSFNDHLNVPGESINLAIISFQNALLKVQTSARAMDSEGLQKVEQQFCDYFTSYDYTVKCEGKYPAWKPEVNAFSKEVEKAMISVFGKSEFKAIHAGLECAIISEKYPKLKLTSIGPNIRSPHSTHEKVELASVEKIYEVVKKVVACYEI